MATESKFDMLDFIIRYEGIIEGFQHLLDSGIVWRLQGCYGRMASRLLDNGDIALNEEG